MKTTLQIDDAVMARLRQEAARTGRTMSELVETALRRLYQSWHRRRELPGLPSFRGGGVLVDVADREAPAVGAASLMLSAVRPVAAARAGRPAGRSRLR
jgi:Ribbon-helix-helix protein, copG family